MQKVAAKNLPEEFRKVSRSQRLVLTVFKLPGSHVHCQLTLVFQQPVVWICSGLREYSRKDRAEVLQPSHSWDPTKVLQSKVKLPGMPQPWGWVLLPSDHETSALGPSPFISPLAPCWSPPYQPGIGWGDINRQAGIWTLPAKPTEPRSDLLIEKCSPWLQVSQELNLAQTPKHSSSEYATFG